MAAPQRSAAGSAPNSERTAGESAPRNYMTPQGYERLRSELKHLLDLERPELVKVIAWAASNGDRSENGDYIYGKKRLREIDRRIRYLTKRVGSAVVVDPAGRAETEQIYFGATVTYGIRGVGERTISIVGIDEADTAQGRVSWISPIAKALLRRQAGDILRVATPGGVEEIEVLDVRYEPLI
jgi:transcription elongation factor GreB